MTAPAAGSLTTSSLVEHPFPDWAPDTSRLLEEWFSPVAGEDLYLGVVGFEPGKEKPVELELLHFGDVRFLKWAVHRADALQRKGLEVRFTAAPRVREFTLEELGDRQLVGPVTSLWLVVQEPAMEIVGRWQGSGAGVRAKVGNGRELACWLLAPPRSADQVEEALRLLAMSCGAKAISTPTDLLPLPVGPASRVYYAESVRAAHGGVPDRPLRIDWLQDENFVKDLERYRVVKTKREPAAKRAVASVKDANDLQMMLAGAPGSPTEIGEPVDPPALRAGGEDRREDVSNAALLVDLHKNDLRWIVDAGVWAGWQATRWRIGSVAKNSAQEAAKKTAVSILDVANAMPESSDDERRARSQMLEWARSSKMGGHIAEMQRLASSDPAIQLSVKDLDAVGHLLNVGNGTLNLRTGALGPHRREDYLTRLSPIAYDPAAECPRWEEFLLQVAKQDLSLCHYLQQAIGYSLTGETLEQCFFILHGSGENGKGVFTSILEELLGDLAETASFDTFLRKYGNSIRVDLAKLRGARLVLAAESNDGAVFDEAVLKSVTGEDQISARFMRENEFTFRPRFKLWLSTNHRPVIRGTDHAMWRRVRLIPFEEQFAKDDPRRDPRLKEKLRAELPGILAWAIKGAVRWYRDGLPACPRVDGATKDYREESDSLGAFLKSDLLTTHESFRIAAQRFFDVWKQWCERTGEYPGTMRAFANKVRERGIKPVREKRFRGYLGFAEAARPDEERDADGCRSGDAADAEGDRR